MSFILAYGAEVVSQRLRHKRSNNNNNRQRGATESSSASAASTNHLESEPATERVQTMDDLCRGLEQNKLRSLSIGWKESDFVRSDRSVAILEKAWQRNRSVTDISIGFKIGQSSNYKAVQVGGGPEDYNGNSSSGNGSNSKRRHAGIPIHTRNRRLLCHTLDRLLAQKSPHYILSLRLVLDDWVPEHLLHAVLKQHVHLQAIEFHGVTCRAVIRPDTTQSLRSDNTNSNGYPTTTTGSAIDQTSQSVRSEFAAAPVTKRFLGRKKKKRRGVANIGMLKTSEGGESSSRPCRTEPVDIVSVVMPHLVRVNSPLKSLKLIDCGLIDDDISYLVNAIQGKNLQMLSVRSNRYLTGTGVMELCTTPVVKGELDLSLCDFNCFDGPAIGAALAQRKTPLQKLYMNGNYQLDSHGLVALVQPGVLKKVISLDLSFCELGESRTARVLKQVRQSHANDVTALRELTLQGCTITGNASRQAFLDLLAHTPHSRIRRFILNDPVESGKYWSTDSLEQVAAVLPHNYDVEELKLDYMHTKPNAHVWETQMEPWLELNRLGRRVVLPGREVSNSEWVTGIHKASKKDLNTLYWFIRQSSEHVCSK